MMTSKEIEDKIIARLVDGTGRAMDSKMCRYRDERDRKCAVGCLIPEELYDPNMEGILLSHLEITGDIWCGGSPFIYSGCSSSTVLARVLNSAGLPATKRVRDMLTEWQCRHDSAQNWEGDTYIGPLDRIMS
jgi:hypothetical protein